MYNPFKLKNALHPHANNDLDDSLQAKKALRDLGHYRVPDHGLSPYPDRKMFGGIKDFQRENGLEVDGIVNPKGPTEAAMNRQLSRKSLLKDEPAKPAIYDPLNLKDSLNPHADNGPDDTLAAKKSLTNLGHYRIPKHGLSPYPDRAMFDGIKDFQRLNKLEVDGIVKPKGPTAAVMNQQLAQGKKAADFEDPDKWRSKKPLPYMVSPFTRPARIRETDGYGSGAFGVPRERNGKTSYHKGVDYVAEPGEKVVSPVTGTVTGNFDPYERGGRNKGLYGGVEILTPGGDRVQVMYIDPNAKLKPGQRVIAGETQIGAAQNIRPSYPPTDKGVMTNHIHIEVEDRSGKRKKFKDPTEMIMARGRF